MRFLVLALALVAAGCASSAQVAATKSIGGKLGIAAEHCSAYGPFKTTRAENGKPPKVKFGGAIVCEK